MIIDMKVIRVQSNSSIFLWNFRVNLRMKAGRKTLDQIEEKTVSKKSLYIP